ncbi:hypothetical protein RhiXN_08464 [Rhizoctonia solani]|uniref:Uncharacterized protein n=1 Tax=Rhizoctonia solani TaxID=456999 RepID=A0A8H8T0G3_9AGAM|nr:uncharacterized protein RhiXN_08464 [Rhizoctonia solani]QRW23428.1 hypothetical protein RhiXN_08464 [Rhizoctonia solani]
MPTTIPQPGTDLSGNGHLPPNDVRFGLSMVQVDLWLKTHYEGTFTDEGVPPQLHTNTSGSIESFQLYLRAQPL